RPGPEVVGDGIEGAGVTDLALDLGALHAQSDEAEGQAVASRGPVVGFGPRPRATGVRGGDDDAEVAGTLGHAPAYLVQQGVSEQRAVGDDEAVLHGFGSFDLILSP